MIHSHTSNRIDCFGRSVCDSARLRVIVCDLTVFYNKIK